MTSEKKDIDHKQQLVDSLYELQHELKISVRGLLHLPDHEYHYDCMHYLQSTTEKTGQVLTCNGCGMLCVIKNTRVDWPAHPEKEETARLCGMVSVSLDSKLKLKPNAEMPKMSALLAKICQASELCRGCGGERDFPVCLLGIAAMFCSGCGGLLCGSCASKCEMSGKHRKLCVRRYL